MQKTKSTTLGSWLFCLLWCRAGMCGKQMCQCSKHRICPAALCITPSYKTYAFKYAHLCPTLLTKFNSTHVKNLQYSICFIAFVVRWPFFTALHILSLVDKKSLSQSSPSVLSFQSRSLWFVFVQSHVFH